MFAPKHLSDGLHLFEVASTQIAVVQAAIEIDTHAPRRAVSVPVAAPNKASSANRVLGAPDPADKGGANAALQDRSRDLG